MERDRDADTFAVIGAAMEVHTQLGNGFLEAVYQEALEHELVGRRIPYVRELPVSIRYKDRPLTALYRADFVCFGNLLVELKAVKILTAVEEAQVLHYLKATGYTRSLLLNFGVPRLEYKRLVRGF